jgi:cyclopropane fatty-acyl-phospholipid synthase-like methyltransferase
MLDRFERSSLPPAKLRFRVSETASASVFLQVGQRTAEDLQSVLAKAQFSLGQPGVALDFGCGCGRTLLWLVRQFPAVQWHGTDVDAEAISWCQNNIQAGLFSVTGPLPPLPYSDHAFDLVYGISVFTHLNEEYQRAWIPELYRVLKRGGLLVLTFYSKHVWESCGEATAVERDEIVFRTSTKLKGILPDWYQTAFQSQSRIIGMLSDRFADVSCIERAFGDQDVVVARK